MVGSETQTELNGNLAGLVAELTRQLASMKVAKLPAVKTETVIEELITAKTRANRRAIYLKSLRHYLGRFAAKFPELTSVISDDVENWMSKFKSDSSRQTWLFRISTLFSFAVRHGYVEKNPCDRIDRITIDRGEPAILTVKQSRQLLATCPPRIKPYLILGMFAGIRPDEIQRMKWQDINLDTETVKVDGKTRRRRIVPLEPIAVELLKGCTFPVDYQWAGITRTSPDGVAPSPSTVRRWKRREGRRVLGGRWRPDILRHTAASYMLALHQDAGKIAFRLGNSPQILMTHYSNPVPLEDAKAFWTIPTANNGGIQ